MSSTSSNPAVNLYAQGGGTASSAQFPSSPVVQTRAPATTDIKGPFGLYPIGQIWIDESAPANYMLSAFSSLGGAVTATWNLLSAGSGDLDALTGDTGTATPSAGSIQIAGTLNQIDTIGAASAVTISLPSEIQSGSVTAIGGIRQFTSVGTAACPNFTSTGVTAVGYGALGVNTATHSTAVGSGALAANVGGTGNTAVGYLAIASNTGNQNTAVGDSALTSNTVNSNSAAFGYQALQLSTGGSNSAFGSQAGKAITSGSGICAFGGQALTGATGSNNIGIGYQAGISVSSGTSNTLIGSQVSSGITSGNSNVIIGAIAGSGYSGTESGNIVIGQGVAGTASENNVTRIGTQGTQTKCVIAGIFGVTVGGSGVAVDVDNTGQLGTVVSSIRYKDHVKDIEGTERIYDLHPVSFVYKNSPEVRRYGLIAEEAVEVIPEMAVYGNGGTLETVRYNDLPIFLLAEIQKLKSEIKDLKEGR